MTGGLDIVIPLKPQSRSTSTGVDCAKFTRSSPFSVVLYVLLFIFFHLLPLPCPSPVHPLIVEF